MGIDLWFVADSTLETLATVDFQNPVSVAENLDHQELTSIADTHWSCVRDARGKLSEHNGSTERAQHVAAFKVGRNECDQGAIESCAALPAFDRSDCDTHFSNHAPVDPGSVLGRFRARAGIDNRTILVVCFVFYDTVPGLTMFVVFVYLLSHWVRAVHGFSRRRARWVTMAMACGAFAIYWNLSTHGFLDVFEPLLEFLDALS